MICMLADAVNPLLSSITVWNVLVGGAIGAFILLPVAALFGIWRRRERMELTHVLVWLAIVIFAPFIGSLLWFVAGTRLHPAHMGDALPASARSTRL